MFHFLRKLRRPKHVPTDAGKPFPRDVNGDRVPIVHLHELRLFARAAAHGLPYEPCRADDLAGVHDRTDRAVAALKRTLADWKP